MYIFDKKKDMYVFDGNFERFLINLGVSQDHITKMQDKKLQTNRDCYQDFSKTGLSERDYISLVPLDKVIGTSRGTGKKFDHRISEQSHAERRRNHPDR